MKIRLGHSPDSDDAFMFWGLAKDKVKTYLDFEHILKDIQTLNEWAMEGRLESTAVSVHALAYVSDKYALLRQGGSFGEGYGPMIISRRKLTKQDLSKIKIAVPGTLTSAFLALNIYFHEELSGPGTPSEKPLYEVVPFDRIIPSVREGHYEAGLIIHEGQLTYEKEGLFLVEDLGAWWKEKTGLHLPLGVNVVRKDLGEPVALEIARCIQESIRMGMVHRKEALDHALQYGRGVDIPTGDHFVKMYVNERTLDMGEEGLTSIQLFLEKGARLGFFEDVNLQIIHGK